MKPFSKEQIKQMSLLHQVIFCACKPRSFIRRLVKHVISLPSLFNLKDYKYSFFVFFSSTSGKPRHILQHFEGKTGLNRKYAGNRLTTIVAISRVLCKKRFTYTSLYYFMDARVSVFYLYQVLRVI